MTSEHQAIWQRHNRRIVLDDAPPQRHDEGLTPPHLLTGWDDRCDLCRRAKAFIARLDAMSRQGRTDRLSAKAKDD